MGSGTYNAVMLSRSLSIPRQGAAIKNLEHACSRWSVNTHSFAWAWGESGISLEDVVILTSLSLHGAGILDLANLSRVDQESVDQENVAELRRLGKLAQSGPRFTARTPRRMLRRSLSRAGSVSSLRTSNPRRRWSMGKLGTSSRVLTTNNGFTWPK